MLSTVFAWIIVSLFSRCARADWFESGKYVPIDMPGQDMPRTWARSAGACQVRCVATPGCVHFSYWPDHGCHLQDHNAKFQAVHASSGITTGPSLVKVASEGICQSIGHNLGGTLTNSLAECLDFCSSNAGCKYASYKQYRSFGWCIASSACDPNDMRHRSFGRWDTWSQSGGARRLQAGVTIQV